MIEPLVMAKTNPLCWILMPQFVERIHKFSQEFTVTGVDNAAHWFETMFGGGDSRMLGIAMIYRGEDNKPKLIGHMLIGLESYLGSPCAMVYQFSKDKGEDFLATKDDGEKSPYLLIRQMLEYWCRGQEVSQVYALVDGAARTKLFGWFGFDDNMRIVRMQLPVHNLTEV